MSGSETRLHSGEGTMGFEMVSYLFVDLAFEDLTLERQGRKERFRLSSRADL